MFIYIDLTFGRIGTQKFIKGNVTKEDYRDFIVQVHNYIERTIIRTDDLKLYGEEAESLNLSVFKMLLIQNNLTYFSSDKNYSIILPKGRWFSRNNLEGKGLQSKSFNENPQIVKDLKAKINGIKP